MTTPAPATPPEVQSLIDRRIRPDVQAMHAYVVQDASGMVKLDAMENPYRLAPALQQALGERLGRLALNRYPDGRIDALRQALADQAGLPPGFGMVLGNGSDELIALLALACSAPDGGAKPVVLAPTPGFVMYAMSAQLQGLQFVGVPLTPDFELDADAMVQALASHQPALVYLAYPNNPTAKLWDQASVAQVIAAAAQVGTLVVVDEAYQPFSSHSYLDVIRDAPQRHGHVLLMRTMSKFGLAGVRIGYLLGHAALVAQIDKVRPPYNVSVLNCECALFALEHAEVYALQAATVRSQRQRLQEALSSFPGLTTWPSDANMILVRVVGQGDRAHSVFEALKARRILVKNVSRMHPLLVNCLRITVGTEDENQQLLAALKEIL